jgi:diguanylate cyclase (GGDEF)-like protein
MTSRRSSRPTTSAESEGIPIPKLPSVWKKRVKEAEFALQPIVYAATGKLYGVEALIRDTDGFDSIGAFFDQAFYDGVLYQLDIRLRKKALEKFSKITPEGIRLFYNLDTRITRMEDYERGYTEKLIEDFSLAKDQICFEISEQETLHDHHAVNDIITHYMLQKYSIAIDHFGSGISGLQMLYYAEPGIIKIDRLFIRDIAADRKKRNFCKSLVEMAHTMGVKVIGVGVENIQEYFACIDIGIDFIQGYLVARPTEDPRAIPAVYEHIEGFFKQDSRKNRSEYLSPEDIRYVKPIIYDAEMQEVFAYFRTNPDNTFAPLVDAEERFLGVIHEKDFKQISYSPYGMSLATNRSVSAKAAAYMKEAIHIDIASGVDKTLDVYHANADKHEGIFITRDDIYHGFIDLSKLLELSHNRTLRMAENINPLTKLPGNDQIRKFIDTAFDQDNATLHHLVYFDFNDFKPFNDVYGFRQGDRAILLFGDILKKELPASSFIAHLGGDDFFVGFSNTDYASVHKMVSDVQKHFAEGCANLYKKKDRERGFIQTKDRYGINRQFELLTVSSAIIEVRHQQITYDFDDLFGQLKKAAKTCHAPVPLGCSIYEPA